MQIVKKGIEFTRTIKHMGRFKEILSVLARNGFDELLWQSGILEKLPHFVLPKSEWVRAERDEESGWQSIGKKLRQSFEELGPTFVKLGQLLSSREDLFPQPFIDEMKKLLDQVKGIPFEEAQEILKKELGRPIAEVFKNINSIPLGTASIGVVYEGTLMSGEEVVIKLQRPHIRSIIEVDISILRILITRLERVSDELKYLGISRLVNDFEKAILSELDFQIEALNGQKLKQNLEKSDPEGIFYIPKIYLDHSTDKILVMEKLVGIPFTKVDEINLRRDVVEKRFWDGSKIFISSLFQDGLYHADLHGGNFFLLQDDRIGIIDFGLVGVLGPKERRHLVAILYCLVGNNFENLIYEFLEVAEYDRIPDIEKLVYDMRHCLQPYMGATFQKLNMAKLVGQMTKTLVQHQIYLPREWFTLFRALVALEGVGRSLRWDFDILALLQGHIHEQMELLFSKEALMEEWGWGARDFLSLLRLFPRHVRWLLRDLTKKNYSFEIVIKGLQRDFHGVTSALHFIVYGFLCGVCLLVGALLTPSFTTPEQKIPTITVIFWAIGFLLFLWGVWRHKK